jgi:hypothetical protein
MTPRRVEHHLDALVGAFDAATDVADAPFVFRSDISRAARRAAIDSSRELISQGDHREAVFWLITTYAKTQKILAHGTEVVTRNAAEAGLRELVADLGITTFADLARRSAAAVTPFAPAAGTLSLAAWLERGVPGRVTTARDV